MSIRLWPESERPREKLLSQGAASLTDAELLAIFLRTGIAGKSAVDLAREQLHHFGGLRPLMESNQQTFCMAPGLGPAKYAQLQAVLEMARRHLEASLVRESALESPSMVRQYLSSKLRHQTREVFACLFLDNRHRVIRFEELFFGTLNAAAVYPREVVKLALEANAAAVILSHNHPSGIAEPSQADRQITDRLKEALALVDIRVLDHMVVGDNEVISFAERGWL
ncbi:RadC family protein [Nitrincola schmidtii]|uniref:RadC family protein n=1 Tax=Nitrincola schmidtii TaxID=1730894 RepID=UPI00124E799A|nr:DNA repair protein RadC [Nitrincola schmidtii]